MGSELFVRSHFGIMDQDDEINVLKEMLRQRDDILIA